MKQWDLMLIPEASGLGGAQLNYHVVQKLHDRGNNKLPGDLEKVASKFAGTSAGSSVVRREDSTYSECAQEQDLGES
jgi:hypothetical protein